MIIDKYRILEISYTIMTLSALPGGGRGWWGNVDLGVSPQKTIRLFAIANGAV